MLWGHRAVTATASAVVWCGVVWWLSGVKPDQIITAHFQAKTFIPTMRGQGRVLYFAFYCSKQLLSNFKHHQVVLFISYHQFSPRRRGWMCKPSFYSVVLLVLGSVSARDLGLKFSHYFSPTQLSRFILLNKIIQFSTFYWDPKTTISF